MQQATGLGHQVVRKETAVIRNSNGCTNLELWETLKNKKRIQKENLAKILARWHEKGFMFKALKPCYERLCWFGCAF